MGAIRGWFPEIKFVTRNKVCHDVRTDPWQHPNPPTFHNPSALGAYSVRSASHKNQGCPASNCPETGCTRIGQLDAAGFWRDRVYWSAMPGAVGDLEGSGRDAAGLSAVGCARPTGAADGSAPGMDDSPEPLAAEDSRVPFALMSGKWPVALHRSAKSPALRRTSRPNRLTNHRNPIAMALWLHFDARHRAFVCPLRHTSSRIRSPARCPCRRSRVWGYSGRPPAMGGAGPRLRRST